jgi:hypothetical protein
VRVAAAVLTGGVALGLLVVPAELLLDARPPDGSFLPRLDLVGMPGVAYAIDDQTAIEVTNGTVDVVSEGQWKLFTASPVASESG